MFEKIKTSYSLVKIAFKYIQKDGELLVYSLLSLLSSLVILVSFVFIGYFSGLFNQLASTTGIETDTTSYNIIILCVAFVYYFIFSFITFFFNTAIIASVHRRNQGKDNKFGDGIRDAMSHLKAIFLWSLINASVTTLLNFLQNKFGENSIVGRIIIGLIGGMWNILTFFSFPLMILNGVGVKSAITESTQLFKKTWGERAIIHVGVSFMFFFLCVLIILLAVGIIFIGMPYVGVFVLFFGMIVLMILSGTCDTIIKTILLHYAQNGTLPDGLEGEPAIENMITVK